MLVCECFYLEEREKKKCFVKIVVCKVSFYIWFSKKDLK